MNISGGFLFRNNYSYEEIINYRDLLGYCFIHINNSSTSNIASKDFTCYLEDFTQVHLLCELLK